MQSRFRRCNGYLKSFEANEKDNVSDAGSIDHRMGTTMTIARSSRVFALTDKRDHVPMFERPPNLENLQLPIDINGQLELLRYDTS